MDAMSILGALLKNKSGGSGGSGAAGGAGGLLGVLGGILGGGAKPAPAPPAPQRRARPDVSNTMRQAYNQYQSRTGAESRDQSRGLDGGVQGSSELDNEQAVVLIRAMINAAKSDGQLDQNEQNKIVEQLGEVTQDEVDFLRKEFDSPLNVREFAWSVPLGLEEQTYSISLMGIKLDVQKEATYLKELAHGLRLQPDTCNAIHQRYNAPQIYS